MQYDTKTRLCVNIDDEQHLRRRRELFHHANAGAGSNLHLLELIAEFMQCSSETCPKCARWLNRELRRPIFSSRVLDGIDRELRWPIFSSRVLDGIDRALRWPILGSHVLDGIDRELRWPIFNSCVLDGIDRALQWPIFSTLVLDVLNQILRFSQQHAECEKATLIKRGIGDSTS